MTNTKEAMTNTKVVLKTKHTTVYSQPRGWFIGCHYEHFGYFFSFTKQLQKPFYLQTNREPYRRGTEYYMIIQFLWFHLTLGCNS